MLMITRESLAIENALILDTFYISMLNITPERHMKQPQENSYIMIFFDN